MPLPKSPGLRRSPRLVGGLMLILAGSVLRSDTTETPADASATYHLFVGRDLRIKDGDELLPVQNVAGEKVEVDAGGAIRAFPINPLPPVMVKPEVKLTRHLVSIAGLQRRRVLSPVSEAALQREQHNSTRMHQIEQELTKNEIWREDFEARDLEPDEKPNLERLTSDLNYGIMMEQMNQHIDETFMSQRDNDRSDAPFDALAISAMFASPVPVENAYAVWLCAFEDPANEDRSFQHVYIRPLPALSPTARRVQTRLDGFPQRFKVRELKVSIFTGNREFATNLSDRKFALTPTQAHEYLVTDYVSRRRLVSSAAPGPITELEVKPRINDANLVLMEPLVIEISAEGVVTGVRLPQAAAGVDSAPYLEALANVPFFPAIRSGRPVAGEYKGSLAQLL